MKKPNHKIEGMLSIKCLLACKHHSTIRCECLQENVIYQATVKADDKTDRSYILQQ